MRRLGAVIIPLGSIACIAIACVWWLYRPPGAPVPAEEDRAAMDPLVLEEIEGAIGMLRQAPRSADRRRRLGMVYEANGMLQLAAAVYRQLVELDGDDARSWYRLGLVLAESGDAGGAAEAFERTLSIGAGYAPALWRLGDLRLEAGDVDGAEAFFAESLERLPADPAAICGMARVHTLRGRPEEAIDLLDPLLAAHPDNGYARGLRAAAYRQLGLFEEAAAENALAAGSEPAFDDAWAAEAGAYETGFSHQLQVAAGLLAGGEVRKAVAVLERVRGHVPDRVAVLNNLGIAYLAADRPDDALEVVTEGLAIEHESPALLVTMSMAYEHQDDLAGALAAATRAVRSGAHYGPAHKQRGLVLARLRRFDEALGELETASELMARDSECLLRLGQVQGNLARWDDAAETFTRATERFPALAGAYVGLAVARAELNDPVAARYAWAQARRLGARLEDQPEAVRERLRGLGG